MPDPVELPPLPEVPSAASTDRWADHVTRYDGMTHDERTRWFNSLSTGQQVEFRAALNAASAVRRANRPAGYLLIVGGLIVGLIYNLLLGGFLVLCGLALNLIGKKK